MKKLPFWCQKVLPLVYDGALSYYEAISKVVGKLNELINWSNNIDDTVSAAGETANEAEDKAIQALNTAELADGKATEAKETANDAKSIAQGIAGDIPTKTSDLTNDSGFITDSDIPTKTSELTNDSGFITNADIPTKTSELTNDSGFITSADVPTETSELTNDSGFITCEEVITLPSFPSTTTLDDLRSYALGHRGSFFSWHVYGATSYTPTTDNDAFWQFTLYAQNSTQSSLNYFVLQAINMWNAEMYICDRSNVWHRLADSTEIPAKPTVTHVNGSAVNVGTGAATTVQTITLSPGVWALECDAQFASNATGYREIHLATSSGGSTMDRHSVVSGQAANGATTRLVFTTFFALTSSTTYYLVATQNSGITLGVTPGYRYMKLA